MNSHISKKPKSFREKCTSWFLCFALLFQSIAPVYASIPSATIEAYLNSEPGIVQDNFLVYKPNEALRSTAPEARNLESFYEWLQTSKPATLNGELGTMIGDEVVQARLIRTQLHIMIGRSLLNQIDNPLPIAYTSEAAQLQGFYQNAFNLLDTELAGIQFGVNLNRNPVDSGLSQPIVWPEYRTIRGMNNVLVPVLYLPLNYYNELDIRENKVELKGSITLANLIINDAVVLLGQQQAFVNVTNDLINNGGTIRAEQDLAITAGKAFKNLGGTISSIGDLKIGAHSVDNQTLLYQYDTDVGYSTVYGQIAGLSSDTGDIRVRSYSDLVFLGSEAQAPNGEITLTASGNILLDSGELVQVETTRFGSGTQTTSEVAYLQSSLSAQDTIELIAGGQILIDGAKIHSDQGHIEILSGLGITIIDEQATTQSQASGKFGKKDVTESVYQTVAIRSILDAGKGVKLHTDLGDITLRAADITSSEGTTVHAQNGAINLLTTVETDHYAYSSVKEGLFTISTKNRGRNIETGVPNSIVGGFAVEAAKSIQVEYTGNRDFTLDEQIAELAKMPGLEWMAAVRDQSITPDVDWAVIETQYETWNESSTSLSPAFAAVIAIAVAIVTQDYTLGIAKSLINSVSATAATNTTLVVAVQAGVTSFISQGALAAGNGIVNGDIVGAMEDFASEDTLKNLAVAMVTAGAIEMVDAKFFEYLDTDRVPLDNLNEARKNLTLAEQATQAVTHASVSSGIHTIINGGGSDDFFDTFLSSVASYGVNVVGAKVAKEIGLAFKTGDITDQVAKYISHAAAGCVLGIAKSAISEDQVDNDCGSGAGGAVIGELAAEIYIDVVDESLGQSLQDYQQNGVDVATITVGMVALLAGGDVNIATYTGANAAKHNALSIKQIKDGAIATGKCLLSVEPSACMRSKLLELAFTYGQQEVAFQEGVLNNLQERLEEVLESPEAAKQLYDAFVADPTQTSKLVLSSLVDAAKEFPAELKADYLTVQNTLLYGETLTEFSAAGDAMANLITAVAGLAGAAGASARLVVIATKSLDEIVDAAGGVAKHHELRANHSQGETDDFYNSVESAALPEPRTVGNLQGGPLEQATQVSGRFSIENGPANGVVYRADNQGNITSYATYDSNGLILKRVDVTGTAHNGIQTPHVLDYLRNTLPDGTIRVQTPRSDPRRPLSEEIP